MCPCTKFEKKPIINNIGHFKLINGILYRANFDEPKDYNGKIVVPTKLRNNKILKLAH